MLLQSLLRDAGVEHEAEDVQVDVLVGQRVADDLVPADAEDLVMEIRIRAGKARIPAAAVRRRAVMAHLGGAGLQPGQGLGRHVAGREAGGLRLKEQAEVVEVVELLARQLRRRAVAD